MTCIAHLPRGGVIRIIRDGKIPTRFANCNVQSDIVFDTSRIFFVEGFQEWVVKYRATIVWHYRQSNNSAIYKVVEYTIKSLLMKMCDNHDCLLDSYIYSCCHNFVD